MLETLKIGDSIWYANKQTKKAVKLTIYEIKDSKIMARDTAGDIYDLVSQCQEAKNRMFESVEAALLFLELE